MLAQDLQPISEQPVTGEISALEDTITADSAHIQFLRNHAENDPQIRILLEFAHRHLSEQQKQQTHTTEATVVEYGPKDARRLLRLRNSFYTREEAPFADLIRMFWLMQSFSNGARNSNLSWLNRISGLDQTLQVKELAGVRRFGVATYECPGQLETLAELDIGFTTLIAGATRTYPLVLLYGYEGASRNRHLAPLNLSVEEVRGLYENRRRLLEVFNFSVAEIDIPKGFFSVPDNFAIARAMIDLGYGSRELDRSFVEYIIDGVTKGAIDRKSKLHGIVTPYVSSILAQGDYEKLINQLKQHLKERGLELLSSEGVHDIADIILKASDYRNLKGVEGFIKTPQKEEQQRVDTPPKEKKPSVRASIGLNERAQMWRRLLSRELTADTKMYLSADNPDFKKVERGLIEKYRGKLEREVGIWVRLLPSDIATVITYNLSELNKYFRQMELATAKQFVEYFMGEIIHIIRPLLDDPSRAYLKFGNKSEQPWDECAYALLGNPEVIADTFWLLGGFFNGKNKYGKNGTLPVHSAFGSALYSHFTIKGKERRDTYISYGIPASKTHIEAIPLISDTPEELLRKFSRMAEYNPDDISRILVGAICSLKNRGDRTTEAEDRFNRNRDVLLTAIESLPEAYRTSVFILNPKDIAGTIDSKIKEEYEASLRMPSQRDTSYIDAAHQKISTFISLVTERRESAKEITTGRIAEAIRSTGQSLEETLSEGEQSLFPRYRRNYFDEVGHSPTQDARLKSLVEYFYSFCFIPPERKEPEASSMVNFLQKIGIDSIRDLASDEALRSTHHYSIENLEYLHRLKERLIALQDRRTGRAQGAVLNDYLGAAVEIVMRLNYRKERLLELMKDGKDVTSEVAGQLPEVGGYLDKVIDNTLYHLLNGVDRVDLANFLHNRFSKFQATIEGLIDNPEVKEKLPKEGIHLEDEVYLLRRLDQDLRAFEERYIADTKRIASVVMFPHELQQFAAFRNAVATMMAYYTQVGQYISGRSQSRPFNPHVVTSQSNSAFSISPQQATDFFAVVLEHLRRELGPEYFAAQRARVEAALR